MKKHPCKHVSNTDAKISAKLVLVPAINIIIKFWNQLLAFQLGALSNGSLSAVRSYCTLKVLWGHVELFIFHFSKNMFSFSKWVSEWAFIFIMCFHFQNVKGFVSVGFPFSEKHNCKQKSVYPLQMALQIRFWTNNQTYNNLFYLFQLSRLYNLS